MSATAEKLLELLPAIHRVRDADIAKQSELTQGPLEDLIAIIAEQVALMEENIEQSYDDLFIETCADWVTPYIGDLIAYQSLHGEVPDVASPRAEVAHTIALRRRKGTAVVLEQLARDVTGWNARAVEFFKALGWTQHMNHNRSNVHYSPDLRNIEALARIGSAFSAVQHTVDVRRVETAWGRFNIQNIGIFLWRLSAHAHTNIPALQVGDRRYVASPLGHALPFYSNASRADTGFITELATPENIEEALGRQQLHDHLDSYYGDEASLQLTVDTVAISVDQIRICNLSDDGLVWAHQPENGFYAIDPVLGRVALPADSPDPADVRISYHRGFSANMGGGEYERESSFSFQESTPLLVPDDHPTIQDALDTLGVGGSGVVEITDNGRYTEALTVSVADNAGIELRAANGNNPHLALTGPLSVTGNTNSRFSINGILVSGDTLLVPDNGSNELAQLDIEHCTWVPGLTLDATGNPVTPGAVSLSIALPGVTTIINRSICGALRAVPESSVELVDSIIDANDITAVAFADLDGSRPGATLSASNTTVIGKIHAREFAHVSNCILLAGLAPADTWNAAIWVERKQTGCVRFSFLPFDAIVPRRYRCQPDSAESAQRLSPDFNSLNYGQAAYCQLSPSTADEIWRGADDESEMGAFHHLFAPQRDRNLRIRLREYLRVGLEAGLFYES